MTSKRVERRLAAILVADMVGYSRLMEADEAGTIDRQKGLRAELIEPKLGEHGGRIVKTTGDGLLVEFASAVDAVNCALEIQRALAEAQAEVADARRMDYRIGINLGDIVIEDGDILGDGVNIAARLEAMAEPGGICVSDVVCQSVAGKVEVTFDPLGARKLKNIVKPVHVHAVRVDDRGSAATATSTAIAAGKPVIAVLPFDNMSGDAYQEYFADGVTEDLITALSKNRWLLVVARNSTFVYKGQSADVRRVADDLGAGFVVEGSVRKAGNPVRITAQLIDAASGSHIWAERYDRDLEDIFAVQDEITSTIAARIEPELAAAERQRARHKSPRSLTAWDSYHLGLSCMYRYTREDTAAAQGHFRGVIEIDPDFAAAHAGLAYTMFLSAVYFGAEPNQALLDAALREARDAVALDQKDAMSHFILGRVHLLRREYEPSISALETAIELNPCLATAHCGLGDSLAYSGRPAEAVPRFEEAIRLSPHDPRKWAFLVYGSLALLFLERYDEAAEWANKAIQVPNATFWADAQLVAVLSHAGRIDEARVAAAALSRRNPDFSANDFANKLLSYVKDPTRIAHFRDGLRKAGLPD